MRHIAKDLTNLIEKKLFNLEKYIQINVCTFSDILLMVLKKKIYRLPLYIDIR